jgi:hypothetical protein
MIAEAGHFALWLAVGVTLVLGTLPLIGAQRGRADWMALARPATHVLLGLIIVAYGCLMVSFINNDFSVLNVASHSNSQLPLKYRIAASWGSHEGSLLLWLLMQAGWDRRCDRLVRVDCDEAERRRRVDLRGWPELQRQARERAWERGYRPPPPEKTLVVDASRDPAYTRTQVGQVIEAIRRDGAIRRNP